MFYEIFVSLTSFHPASFFVNQNSTRSKGGKALIYPRLFLRWETAVCNVLNDVNISNYIWRGMSE
jgi:hypothetical protein